MNAEKMVLLSQKLVLLSLAKDNTERKRLTQEIAALNDQVADAAQTVYCRTLKFSDKEISKMPKTFRKEFRIDGCTAHVRKRCDARYRCSYEIRYRRNGYNVSASATTLEEAKEKFIQKLKTADKKEKTSGGTVVPTTFYDFTLFWLENYHKRRVCEKTYKGTLYWVQRTLSQWFVNKSPMPI